MLFFDYDTEPNFFSGIIGNCSLPEVPSIICNSDLRKCGIEGQVTFSNNFTTLLILPTKTGSIPSQIGYLTNITRFNLGAQ